MENVAQLQRELAAAKASAEAEQYANRLADYRAKLAQTITARDHANALGAKMKQIDAQRQKQGRVISKLQEKLAGIDTSIEAASVDGLDVRSESERAADESKRAHLAAQLESDKDEFRTLNADFGSTFAEWIQARRAFQEADWRAGRARPVSPAELQRLNRTPVTDGSMGELSAVSERLA